jgi:hypothetical protein
MAATKQRERENAWADCLSPFSTFYSIKPPFYGKMMMMHPTFWDAMFSFNTMNE